MSARQTSIQATGERCNNYNNKQSRRQGVQPVVQQSCRQAARQTWLEMVELRGLQDDGEKGEQFIFLLLVCCVDV
jgi:hypothetical protein